MRGSWGWIAAAAWIGAACGEGKTDDLRADAGPRDREVRDEGPFDLGPEDRGVRPDSGVNFDPSCVSCRGDGDSCEFSINCAAGSICNKPTDELFDPTLPEGVCIRVVCDENIDCAEAKVCTLDRLCRPPTCQNDNECTGGDVCLSGSCVPRPAPIDPESCETFVSRQIVVRGQEIILAAVARDSNNVPLPAVQFTFDSSDPQVVSVNGSIATAQNSGTSIINANAGSVACSAVTITVRESLPQGAVQTRVTVVAADTGAPIANAQAVIQFSDGTITEVTGTDGTVGPIDRSAAIVWVTAFSAGREIVSVQNPPRDVRIALVRVEPTVSSGSYGYFDLSSQRPRDVVMGLAGFAFNAHPLDLERTISRWLAPSVTTVIDAPELGLNNQATRLPEGMVWSFGQSRFTEDVTRCHNDSPPTPLHKGCYLASAPLVRNTSIFAFGGGASLAELSRLSGIFGGDDPSTSWTALVPWLATKSHATIAQLNRPTLFPKVPVEGTQSDCSQALIADDPERCQPDYSRFQRTDLALDTPVRIGSVFDLPVQPDADPGRCLPAALVIAGVQLPGRGLLPLGLNSAISEDGSCQLSSIINPFSDNGLTIPSGAVPLKIAPAHSGAESGTPVWIYLATETEAFIPGGVTRFSAVIEQTRRFQESARVLRAPLQLPRADIERASATITFAGPAGAASGRGIKVYGLGSRWTVWMDPAVDELVLPDVVEARTVFNATGARVELLAIQLPVQHQEAWTLGGAESVENALERGTSVALAVDTCGSGPGCTVR